MRHPGVITASLTGLDRHTGVLLFGGSFDPPTRAHAAVADRARNQLFGPRGLLVLVPASRSPHKDTAPRASDHTRLDMLDAVAAGLDPARVWTEELDRAEDNTPSYWVDTLAAARQRIPSEIPLRFLIGADQALSAQAWHRWDDIEAIAEPAVVLRTPIHTRPMLRRELAASGAWDDEAIDRWVSRVLDVPMLDASATEARQLIAERAPRAAIERLILPDVHRLAQRERCYDA
ncbi:MAG: hypothetical protein AAGG07_01155 [Planctomycetota bacterium]